MKVYGTFTKKVEIDPIDVIDELISDVTGYDAWITIDGKGKCWRNWDESAGTHSIHRKEEISKDKFDHYTDLKQVKLYLENTKTN